MDGVKTDKPIRAAAGWDDVVFVCGKCMRKMKRDDEAPPLRKWLKRELKARGAGKRLRIVECGCLDLCPKHGVTLARGRELGEGRKKLRVLRPGDDPQCVLDWLLDPPADQFGT
ncbi:(2Fe-2S) ferredoxin domain-containing protein [Solimonas marina]|uniref:(2Fe-2S) ferredoxin domain-containing protein n=1 Tax=Solimonas marina TaxID=2714601 RepID=A0A969WBW9_9GAMM|nr:(2Fe-2S) ferredoxin domain-containing protein [Solimonas marina]NKF23699.1 (2Fe-2S) ferredoxin domain-containing protein [Solimonas marina]